MPFKRRRLWCNWSISPMTITSASCARTNWFARSQSNFSRARSDGRVRRPETPRPRRCSADRAPLGASRHLCRLRHPRAPAQNMGENIRRIYKIAERCPLSTPPGRFGVIAVIGPGGTASISPASNRVRHAAGLLHVGGCRSFGEPKGDIGVGNQRSAPSFPACNHLTGAMPGRPDTLQSQAIVGTRTLIWINIPHPDLDQHPAP